MRMEADTVRRETATRYLLEKNSHPRHRLALVCRGKVAVQTASHGLQLGHLRATFGQATFSWRRRTRSSLHAPQHRSAHLSHLVEHQVRPLGLRRVAAPRDELGAHAAGRRRHTGAREVLACREHLRHAHCTRAASGRGVQQDIFSPPRRTSRMPARQRGLDTARRGDGQT